MPSSRAWSLATALSMAALLAVAGSGAVHAHEPRTGGGFRFVVGWGQEPAYTGSMNSVQLTLTEANGGAPVTDLGDALRVEVVKGSERVTLPLEPVSRTPGEYRAWLTPTRPGSYTFRLIGSVRGQPVDESFTSSENTFDDVADAADIQFPIKDPSTGELATRVEREFPRLDTRTDDLEADLDRTRTLAQAGLAAGVVGLVVAAAALVALRRRAAPRIPPEEGKTRRGPEQARSLSR